MPPIKFLDLSILSSFRPNVNPSTSKELKETDIRAYIASIWFRSHAYELLHHLSRGTQCISNSMLSQSWKTHRNDARYVYLNIHKYSRRLILLHVYCNLFFMIKMYLWVEGGIICRLIITFYPFNKSFCQVLLYVKEFLR